MKLRCTQAATALAALSVPARGALAQGCVQCRTSAATGAADAAGTFDLAILVLLIPTLSIFVGVLIWAFRYRNRSLSDQECLRGQPADTHTTFNPAAPAAGTSDPPPFDEAAFLRSLRPPPNRP
ncbi:MAG: hypothetical protein HYY26_01915 [Acidobacteria bacterium]|nr:hypothetical protein [Acidobacteriota bacterium]